MASKKERIKKGPVVAAGNYDYLEKKATGKERKRGDYTKVTRLALDEVDPS